MSVMNDLGYAYSNNIAVIVVKKDGLRVKGKIKVLSDDHVAIDTGISTTAIFFKSIQYVDVLYQVIVS
jgi:hypothetical protein